MGKCQVVNLPIAGTVTDCCSKQLYCLQLCFDLSLYVCVCIMAKLIAYATACRSHWAYQATIQTS